MNLYDDHHPESDPPAEFSEALRASLAEKKIAKQREYIQRLEAIVALLKHPLKPLAQIRDEDIDESKPNFELGMALKNQPRKTLEAILYFEKARAEYARSGTPVPEDLQCCESLALLHARLYQFTEALAYHKDAQTIYRTLIENTRLLVLSM